MPVFAAIVGCITAGLPMHFFYGDFIEGFPTVGFIQDFTVGGFTQGSTIENSTQGSTIENSTQGSTIESSTILDPMAVDSIPGLMVVVFIGDFIIDGISKRHHLRRTHWGGE